MFLCLIVENLKIYEKREETKARISEKKTEREIKKIKNEDKEKDRQRNK